MTLTEKAAERLAEAGFEPLPTQDGCFTLKFLSAEEVDDASSVLRGLEGLFLSVEGVDDEDEHVDEVVESAGQSFGGGDNLPAGEGYHLTVFEA